MNAETYGLTKEFIQKFSGYKDAKEDLKKYYEDIQRWVEEHRVSLLTAWWAEHGFSPGNAIMVTKELSDGANVAFRRMTANEEAFFKTKDLNKLNCDCEDRSYRNECSRVVQKVMYYCPSCGRTL